MQTFLYFDPTDPKIVEVSEAYRAQQAALAHGAQLPDGPLSMVVIGDLKLEYRADRGYYRFQVNGELDEIPLPLRELRLVGVGLHKPNAPATKTEVRAGRYVDRDAAGELTGVTATVDTSLVGSGAAVQVARHFRIFGSELTRVNQYLRELRRGDHQPDEAAE